MERWWPEDPVYCPHITLGHAVLLVDKPFMFAALPVPTCSDALQYLMPSCRHSPDLTSAAQELAKWHTQSAEAISSISCRGGSGEGVS